MIVKRTKQKSSRYLRVAEIIKKAVSEVLLKNELPLNPNFQFPLSVVSIEMSPDLRIAYVYVSTHENLEKDEIINRLDSCRKYLAKEVNQLISLKFVPKLIYRYDLTIEKYDQISKLHKSYGVFLTPTRMDSQGVSRDEAMSSGLVPITNAVTAIPEFVDDNSGILVDGEDFEGMANGIIMLYENPEVFSNLSRNASLRILVPTKRPSSLPLPLVLAVAIILNPALGVTYLPVFLRKTPLPSRTG